MKYAIISTIAVTNAMALKIEGLDVEVHEDIA